MIGVCLRIKSMNFYFIPKIEWYFLLDNKKNTIIVNRILLQKEKGTLFFLLIRKKKIHEKRGTLFIINLGHSRHIVF